MVWRKRKIHVDFFLEDLMERYLVVMTWPGAARVASGRVCACSLRIRLVYR